MAEITYSIGNYRRYEMNDENIVITNRLSASPVYLVKFSDDNEIETTVYANWDLFEKMCPGYVQPILDWPHSEEQIIKEQLEAVTRYKFPSETTVVVNSVNGTITVTTLYQKTRTYKCWKDFEKSWSSLAERIIDHDS